MTPTTPITQPAVESLRNALQIAEMGRDGYHGGLGKLSDSPYLARREATQAFSDIGRLIRDALEQLSEPSPSMIVALRSVVENHSSLMMQHESPEEMDRYWRDSAAIVLRAAVTGFTPGLGAS